MAERQNAVSEAPQGYSIRVASRLTGVSSDTLRMWERRYGFPKPVRNESQVRVYTDADIERLVLISRALKGHGDSPHISTSEGCQKCARINRLAATYPSTYHLMSFPCRSGAKLKNR